MALTVEDDSVQWWAGVQGCFASVAIAAALATGVSTRAAIQIRNDKDELPAGSLANSKAPDEHFWPRALLPAPVAASVYQRLPLLLDPEELPAGKLSGQPDEDFWAQALLPAPVAGSSYQRLPLVPDPEELPAASLSGEPDEDLWLQELLPAPLASSLYQRLLVLPDPEELPAGKLNGQPDEDLWAQALLPAPLAATIFQRLPLVPDPEELPAASLSGQPDEDFWPQAMLAAPVAASIFQRLPLVPDPEELPAASLHGQPEEDLWAQALLPAPVTAALYQRLPLIPDPEELPAGNLHGQPEEDLWLQALLPEPVAAVYFQLAIVDGEFAPAAFSPEEDFWPLQPPQPAAALYYEPVFNADAEFAPAVALSADEDVWPQALLPAPAPASLYSLLRNIFDAESPVFYRIHSSQEVVLISVPVFPLPFLYPLSLPVLTPPLALAGPQEFTLALEAVAGENDSPFTFSDQVFLWPGDRFTLEVTLPPLTVAQAEPWVAFLDALLGKYGTFLMGDFNRPTPLGPMSGAPTVNGPNASGSNQLLVRGATPSIVRWAVAGDYIQVTAAGGLQRLHKILQDATTDISGNTTLQIRPSIREALADGVTVVTANCAGTFRLESNQETWKIDYNHLYAISFKAREAGLP